MVKNETLVNSPGFREIPDPKYCQFRRNMILIDPRETAQRVELAELKKMAGENSAIETS